MKAMKSVGILVLATVVLASVGGCKSKGSAGQGEAAARQDEAAGSLGIPKELALDLGNNASMKLVLIPAGKFMMGSPKDEKDRQPDEGLAPGAWVSGNPQVEVTITKPFYMGVYDVTVDQYAQFVNDTGQKHDEPRFKQTGDHPVVNVSWDDADAFCKWLSKKTGKKVQLPTEAQWEYACRAGSKTRFSYGQDDDYSKLGDYAWYDKNCGGTTHPVGQKKPNAWGLYDMHGNVCQWCSDWGAESYASANAVDPQGPGFGSDRVLRGGCWCYNPLYCRSASRDWNSPGRQGGRRVCFGLRVVAVGVPGVD